MARTHRSNAMKYAIALAFSALSLLSASAQIPSTLHHQGRISVDGVNFDGTGQFKFMLYFGAAAGTVNSTRWKNDDANPFNGNEPVAAVPVQVTKGLYSVALGTAPQAAITKSLIPTSLVRHLYLRIWFNDGTNGFQQLSPDRKIHSSIFARYAEEAHSLDSTASIPPSNLPSNVVYQNQPVSLLNNDLGYLVPTDLSVSTGAQGIGILDSGSNFTSVTVEGALAELATTGGGGGDVTAAGNNTFTGYNQFEAAEGLTATGTLSPITSAPPVSGDGVRMMWYPKMPAFRVGEVSGLIDPFGTGSTFSAWDSGHIGRHSFASGKNTVAVGEFSTALGENSAAGSNHSFAGGDHSVAFGVGSFAYGFECETSDRGAVALGDRNIASGYGSFAVGVTTEASGIGSVAVGNGAFASNNSAISAGQNTKATGYASVALGFNSEANGLRDTAIGSAALADGGRSAAIGSGSIAHGESSVAIGSGAQTSTAAERAIALGSSAKAFGPRSAALGIQAEATGLSATAVGSSATAAGDHSVALAGGTTFNQWSMAFGPGSETRGDYAVALGFEAIASNRGAVSLGYANTASQLGATACGTGNTSSGVSSFTTGNQNVASNLTSAAIGQGLISDGAGELACGKWNDSAEAFGSVFCVGSGIDDGNRANAMWITVGGFSHFNKLMFLNEGIRVNSGAAEKPGGGPWVATSDARLKDIQNDFTPGLAEVCAIDPVVYKYKADNHRQLPAEPEFVGVIAQQVEKVIPEAVTLEDDGYRSVDAQPITYAMLNAIKELKAENDALRERLEKLEANAAR